MGLLERLVGHQFRMAVRRCIILESIQVYSEPLALKLKSLQTLSILTQLHLRQGVCPRSQAIHPSGPACKGLPRRVSGRSHGPILLQTIFPKHHPEQCSKAVVLNQGDLPPRGHLVVSRDVSDGQD